MGTIIFLLNEYELKNNSKLLFLKIIWSYHRPDCYQQGVFPLTLECLNFLLYFFLNFCFIRFMNCEHMNAFAFGF